MAKQPFTLKNIGLLLRALNPLKFPELPNAKPPKVAFATGDVVDKKLYELFQKNKRVVKRLYSDELIPWLRPKNYPPFGKLEYDRIQTPMTLVIQVKTLNRYVRPPVGLRSSRDFVPIPTYKDVVYKELWYRYLGPAKTYQEAKRETARYLDKIYQQIYSYGLPIVAIKIFLVDWTAGKAIPHKVLNWKIFSTRTFEGWVVDNQQLRAWGIPADHAKESPRRMSGGPTEYWDQIESGKNVIETTTGYNVETLIASAVNQFITSQPKTKKETLDLIKLKRIQYIATSIPFKRRVTDLLVEAYKDDAKLRQDSLKRNGDRVLINLAEKFAREELKKRRLLD